MKTSELYTGMSKDLMKDAESEQLAASEYQGNEFMVTACLGSSRALLAMSKRMREAAGILRAEEATAERAATEGKDGV